MHYLVIIGALLFFAFIFPLKTTLSFAVTFALVTLVVVFTARLVSGVETTMGAAAKAVCLAFAFLAVALFTLISFSVDTGVRHFTGIPGLAVLAAFMLSYSLGFKVALDVPLGPSIVIAGVSTVASAIALTLLQSVMGA